MKWGETENIPSETWKETLVSTLSILIQHYVFLKNTIIIATIGSYKFKRLVSQLMVVWEGLVVCLCRRRCVTGAGLRFQSLQPSWCALSASFLRFEMELCCSLLSYFPSTSWALGPWSHKPS